MRETSRSGRTRRSARDNPADDPARWPAFTPEAANRGADRARQTPRPIHMDEPGALASSVGRDPEALSQMHRHGISEPPGHRDRCFALPRFEFWLPAVKKGRCLVFAQLAAAHEQMDARTRIGTRDHFSDRALSACLRLARPLHPVRTQEVVLVVVAGGERALIERRQQDEIPVKAHNPGIPVPGIKTCSEQPRNFFPHVFTSDRRTLGWSWA